MAFLLTLYTGRLLDLETVTVQKLKQIDIFCNHSKASSYDCGKVSLDLATMFVGFFPLDAVTLIYACAQYF